MIFDEPIIEEFFEFVGGKGLEAEMIEVGWHEWFENVSATDTGLDFV